MELKYLALFSLVFLFLPHLVMATDGPDAYLIEQTRANFSSDGSYSSATTYTKCNTNPCMYGYVQVNASNTLDVLQQIRINISSGANTNMQTTVVADAYEGAFLSTTPTSIDLNTTESSEDTEFNITDDDDAPIIKINLTSISNWQGGYDLYDQQNIYPSGISNPENILLLNFSVSHTGTDETLYGVTLNLRFNNTNPNNDTVSIKLGSEDQTGGTSATASDADTDGYNDTVTWTGDLSATETAYVWFNISTTDLLNFNGTSLELDDLSSRVTEAYYINTTSTLSGRTITGNGPYDGKFCRGPIRQGIDLAEGTDGNWDVRGFLLHRGSGSPALTYNLTNWTIYQVDNTTGQPMTPGNQTKFFQCGGNNYCTLTPTGGPDSDGKVDTTDSTWTGNANWYDTGFESKPYYGVGFEWEVVWNDTYYRGYINSTYDMRTLYKIDMSPDMTSYGAVNPGTAGQNVTLNYTTTFIGNDNSPADYVEIVAVVPARPHNTAADHGNWTIHEDSISVRTYYSGAWHTLAGGNYNYSFSQPDSVSDTDGYVDINITGFDSNGGSGQDMKLNERVRLRFNVSSSASFAAGDRFNFTANSTMLTSSGTPLTEEFPDPEEISIGGKQLTGWKELIGDPAHPTWIDSQILIEVVSSGLTSKVEGIKFTDYIPTTGTNITSLADYKNAATLYVYNGTTTSWEYYEVDTNFTITSFGTVALPDGTSVMAFEFNTTDGLGWSLGNGEKINVSYTFNVTSSGAYVLPTIIAGFDPLTGDRFGTTLIGSIYVNVPKPLSSLQIEEGEFKQAKMAFVNKPVLWMKDFNVYNPNGRPANSKFAIRIFDDAQEGYVSYYNEYGKKVDENVRFTMTNEGKFMEWESTVNPFESRSYEVRATTPPVMEVDRNVEVLEKLPYKKVKIMMDVFLKNFGGEDYENVVLDTPIGVEDMIKARDSFGNELQFTGGKDSSRIIVGDMNSDAMKSVNIIYKQSYPTVIVTPEKDEFILGSAVGLNILVINGGEKVDFPFLEIEIYTPGMDIIESDVRKIESLQPLEKTELSEEYFLPVSAPTGMYMASVSFREDFVTLASGTGQFFLTGAEEGLTQTWGWILLMIVVILMAWVSYKRIQSVRKSYKSTRVI